MDWKLLLTAVPFFLGVLSFLLGTLLFFWSMWNPTRIQLTGIELTWRDLKMKVPVFFPAIAFLLCGLFLIYVALAFYKDGGKEKSNPSLVDTSYSSLAFAQMPPVSVGGTSTAAPSDRNEGWVYLGPAHDPTQWNFDVDNPERGETKIEPGDIARAKRNMPLRTNHFKALTGTELGRVLGFKEPKKIGVVPMDACVIVKDQARVAISELWLEVQREDC